MIRISKISDDNLEKIKGGATVTVWTGIAIASIVIFLAGLIDGMVNPGGCKA
ncbi:MAG: hypothetical protein IKE63_01770 [Bacilli bacterium]|nr:hypothetical protein [Bacilli bacterium]